MTDPIHETTAHVLADFPAVTILALPERHNIALTDDKGYARTAPVALYVRRFPNDRYDFIRAFTVGCDGDNAENVWAYGNGAMITAEARRKEIAVGCDLYDTVTIDGRQYRVHPAPNHNIQFVPV
jgi:hypothetical protein